MISRRLVSALALAGLILAVAGGLRYAENTGLMTADAARRAMQIMIGLGLAAYANLMPKQSRSLSSPEVERRVQLALRVGGWSLTLAGLAYAGLWAFAPLAIADTGSMLVVATGLAITMAYSLWTLRACRAAARG